MGEITRQLFSGAEPKLAPLPPAAQKLLPLVNEVRDFLHSREDDVRGRMLATELGDGDLLAYGEFYHWNRMLRRDGRPQLEDEETSIRRVAAWIVGERTGSVFRRALCNTILAATRGFICEAEREVIPALAEAVTTLGFK